MEHSPLPEVMQLNPFSQRATFCFAKELVNELLGEDDDFSIPNRILHKLNKKKTEPKDKGNRDLSQIR